MRKLGLSTNNRCVCNIFTQFKLLFSRSLRETFRGKGTIIIKAVQQVTTALIYGGIYSLGNNQASIRDRIGLISLIAIGTTNLSMASTIRSFPKEKNIVTAEISSKLYSTFPYFIAKAVSEIPLVAGLSVLFGSILYPLVGLQKERFSTFLGLSSLHSICSQSAGLLVGSISPNSDVSLALFPPIIVLNIIFDGKNISTESIPKIIRWLPKLGLIRWGYEGMCVNELKGLSFESDGPFRGPVAKTGEEALARYGLEDASVERTVRSQLNIIAASWFLSFLGLSATKQKYVTMKPTKK